jgi:phosphoglycolate phosphatase
LPELRLALFDVDGTLIDSQRHIIASMHHAFAAFGLAPPGDDAIRSIVGLSLPVAMARLTDEADPEALAEAYKQGFADRRISGAPEAASPLYPGALAALDRIGQDDHTLMGVATGKSRRGLDHVLGAHGLEGRFITRQVADDHPSKPHPSMIFAALADSGVDPRNAVMIGDTTYDMDMAVAAGVTALGVGWGYHPAEALRDAGAVAVLDRFGALPDALARIWGMT